jgi:hypothetical protein
MRYTFPVGCAVAHSGASVRLTERTTASPIGRMDTSVGMACGSLAGLNYWRRPASAYFTKATCCFVGPRGSVGNRFESPNGVDDALG